MNLTSRVDGIEKVLRGLDKMLGSAAVSDIDKITETYARKMANESAGKAPIDSGLLKLSIASSPVAGKDKHTWEWGSNLDYAVRQEYENASNKAFIRRAIWDNEEAFKKAVIQRVTKGS